jgi:tRNA pseudouridine38-40 synthase
MEKNVLLTIEYDGTRFSGWQKQPGVRTVQGLLEEMLAVVCKTEIRLNGVSRTDAGVHALAHRASFTGEFGIPVERLKIAVNNMLSGRTPAVSENADVRILEARRVPDRFHARYDARGKMYRYIIDNNREMPVFCRNYRYHVAKPLDADKMREAASFVVGTHDFRCFQASGQNPDVKTVKTVYSLEVFRDPAAEGLIVLEVCGDGFLYNMVRIIVGTLVEIGLGKKEPRDMKLIIGSRDRRTAGHTAPPQGLYLAEVYYDERSFADK